MNPREDQTASDSSSGKSTGTSRRTFLAAMMGLPLLAGCSQFVSVEFSEADLTKIGDAIEEYRTALQVCLETPSQDTAETLNRISRSVNTMYFMVQPDLEPKQKLDIGVQVGDLNTRAIGAVQAVQPKTRYTQHYLDSIKNRESVWQLQAMGDHEGVRQLLEKQLEAAENNVTETMSYEESMEYMSQPVNSKE